jgi:hypothetical protein
MLTHRHRALGHNPAGGERSPRTHRALDRRRRAREPVLDVGALISWPDTSAHRVLVSSLRDEPASSLSGHRSCRFDVAPVDTLVCPLGRTNGCD